jgi:hypothetical protein
MAWQDDINEPLVIITGDGTRYEVQWQPDGRVQEFNIAEFDFNNVSGSLVVQGQPKGRKYPFKFFFQGDNHIRDVDSFLVSASDKRPWQVQHPLYGPIICKVASLSIDDSKLNVSEISCTLLETIVQDTPRFTEAPIDRIISSKAENDQAFLDAFTVTPSVTDINTMLATNKQLFVKGNRKLSTDGYFNTFSEANSAVISATTKPIFAMRKTQALINAPSQFSIAVKDRVGLFTDQIDSFRLTINNISGRKSSKKVYELQGGALISGMALAASTPIDGDYANKDDVLSVIQDMIDYFNLYLTDLDSLMSENGGLVDAYIPDATSLNQLGSLINFTISNLFQIALNSKQQRTIILEEDSNWIVLAHRFYGLSADDSQISRLMKENNAGLSETLGVRKGRVLVYYV